MNMYALSTLVQAEEIDIENLLRNFEGKKNIYEKITFKGVEIENVPIRANAMEEQYLVDAMEVVLERQEAEAKAKADAIKAEEEAIKKKIEDERQARAAAKQARAKGKLSKAEEKKLAEEEAAVAAAAEEKRRKEEEEAAARPAAMLAEILPDTRYSEGLTSVDAKGNIFTDEYEADIEAHKTRERDEQFILEEQPSVLSDGFKDGGDQISLLSPRSVETNDFVGEMGSTRADSPSAMPFDGISALGDGDLGSIGEEHSVRFDFGDNQAPVAPGSIDGGTVPQNEHIQTTGSVVSVAGGGSIHSTTSVTADMVNADAKVRSFYTEVKIGPGPGKELPESYLISIEKMLELVRKAGFDESDVELMESMFRLVDQRGFEEADIRHVLVPFALAVGSKSGSVPKCITLLFTVFDRAKTDCVTKEDMLKIFNLINEAVLYIGDKPLDPNYVIDLVDSVFTAAGRIDGMVQWIEYVELIAEHPIIEMLLAPQYQGLARDKVFDEETLRDIDVSVGVDYSDKKGNNIS